MAGGFYKMRAYLKHYTAYSVETDRFTFSANLSAFQQVEMAPALRDDSAPSAPWLLWRISARLRNPEPRNPEPRLGGRDARGGRLERGRLAGSQ